MPPRIVSLLPATTEILFAVGAGDDVVGVTFECDYPAEARGRRIISTSEMPEGLSPRQIDAWVSEATRAGIDLYRLDAGALADLDADLVVTQDLCAVCAVDQDSVEDALLYLGCRAQVSSHRPRTLEGVIDSVVDVAEAAGRGDAGAALAELLRARLAAVQSAVRGRRRPRVLFLEWVDPPYAPGHWVPEMVTAAGGTCLMGEVGATSVRVTEESVLHAEADLVVCAPCGFDTDGAAAQAEAAITAGRLPAGIPVWAVDANAAFARPGPRVVDGVETLAAILHPDLVGAPAIPGRRVR